MSGQGSNIISSGCVTIESWNPFSLKSGAPLPSRSAGSVYPSTTSVLSSFLMTIPRTSTYTPFVEPYPKIPLLSWSVNPASCVSKHPSLSESRSYLLSRPSPSESSSPSQESNIPSLSSSRSSASVTPSSSKSEYE